MSLKASKGVCSFTSARCFASCTYNLGEALYGVFGECFSPKANMKIKRKPLMASLEVVLLALSLNAANVHTVSAATSSALGDAFQDLVYTPIPPCRIVDTRLGSDGTGPLAAGSITQFAAVANSFQVQGGSNSTCGIPVGTGAMAITFAMVNTKGVGDIRAWPTDGSPMPNSSIGVFNPSSAASPSPCQVAFNGGSTILSMCMTCVGSQFQIFAEGAHWIW